MPSTLAVALGLALVPLSQAWNVELPPCLDDFKPFVSSGCFQETSEPLLIFRSGLDQRNMTVETCVAECKGNGFRYAGLEYYGVCFCGSTVNGPQVPDSQCSLPCSGNKSETCGGNKALSVWQDPTFTKSPEDVTVDDYTSLGCFTDDSPKGRSLSWPVQVNGRLTTKKCLSSCEKRGFPFAGTEYGGECWCGVVLANDTAKVHESECSMPCRGDASDKCGGRARLSLYVAKDLESLEPCGQRPTTSSSSEAVVTVTMTRPGYRFPDATASLPSPPDEDTTSEPVKTASMSRGTTSSPQEATSDSPGGESSASTTSAGQSSAATQPTASTSIQPGEYPLSKPSESPSSPVSSASTGLAESSTSPAASSSSGPAESSTIPGVSSSKGPVESLSPAASSSTGPTASSSSGPAESSTGAGVSSSSGAGVSSSSSPTGSPTSSAESSPTSLAASSSSSPPESSSRPSDSPTRSAESSTGPAESFTTSLGSSSQTSESTTSVKSEESSTSTFPLGSSTSVKPDQSPISSIAPNQPVHSSSTLQTSRYWNTTATSPGRSSATNSGATTIPEASSTSKAGETLTSAGPRESPTSSSYRPSSNATSQSPSSSMLAGTSSVSSSSSSSSASSAPNGTWSASSSAASSTPYETSSLSVSPGSSSSVMPGETSSASLSPSSSASDSPSGTSSASGNPGSSSSSTPVKGSSASDTPGTLTVSAPATQSTGSSKPPGTTTSSSETMSSNIVGSTSTASGEPSVTTSSNSAGTVSTTQSGEASLTSPGSSGTTMASSSSPDKSTSPTTAPTTPESSPTSTAPQLCTATSIVPAQCEWQRGDWCAPPLPDWDSRSDCLVAAKTCALQVASCFKYAGWPHTVDCFDFQRWCRNVQRYCAGSCRGRGRCSKGDCWDKYKPGFGTPPSTTTSVAACAATSATSKPTVAPPTTSCPPATTNICRQPANEKFGYGPGKPVGGIPLPVVGCNDMHHDWRSKPYKLYTEPDSGDSPSFRWPERPNVCADSCKQQYQHCRDTYVDTCRRLGWKDGFHRRREGETDTEFSRRAEPWSGSWAANPQAVEARSSDNGYCATTGDDYSWAGRGSDTVNCWGWGGNTPDMADQRCRAQYTDCLAVNNDVDPGDRCKTWCRSQ